MSRLGIVHKISSVKSYKIDQIFKFIYFFCFSVHFSVSKLFLIFIWKNSEQKLMLIVLKYDTLASRIASIQNINKAFACLHTNCTPPPSDEVNRKTFEK